MLGVFARVAGLGGLGEGAVVVEGEGFGGEGAEGAGEEGEGWFGRHSWRAGGGGERREGGGGSFGVGGF